MKLRFCGAAGTVTGSRYPLTHEGKQFLLDCGLFQGLKQLRRRNVVNVDAFSAHADAGELIHWAKGIGNAPHQMSLTHGEPAAADALKGRIKAELGWEATVAADLQEVLL